MHVVAMISSKGGVAKSTLAACIAAAASEAGQTVVVLDADPQQTLVAWHKRREAGDIVVRAVQPSELRENIAVYRKTGMVDLIVIDTAGVAGLGAGQAAAVADLVLVPVGPSQMDLDSVPATVAPLRTIKARFGFVVSSSESLPRARETARALVQYGKVAPGWTSHRVAYKDAIGAGQGVTEYDPNSRPAEEIGTLLNWINEQIKANDAP